MKKEYAGLIIVVALVLLVIFSFVLYHHSPFINGTKLIIDTKSTYLSNTLSEDYLKLKYDLSTIENVTGYSKGDVVYVSLIKTKFGIWVFEEVTKTKPQKVYFLKGEVSYVHSNSIEINYGIETYYLGNSVDMPRRIGENITVELMVSKSGRARISEILQNGAPLEISYEIFDIRS